MASGITVIPYEQRVSLVKHVDHITLPRVICEMVRNEPAFQDVKMTRAFPTSKGEVPCIRYRLIRRTAGHEQVELYKPRLRHTYRNEDGTITEVWSQWMNCSYQFDCCAGSADEVEDLSWTFDNYLSEQIGELKKLGVSEMWFDEEMQDMFLPQTADVHTRSLKWNFRLDRITLRNTDIIRQLRIRALYPQEDAVEEVVRGDSLDFPDVLEQTFISKILYVSNASISGIARTDDYIPHIDFEIVYDPVTTRTGLLWLEPGRRPSPGQTYYVRYHHWTAFSTLYLPY